MLTVAEQAGRTSYETKGGIAVERIVEHIVPDEGIDPITDALDTHLGVLLASSYEYPGRYTRWDIGFIDPPLQVVSTGRTFRLFALNERGKVLLAAALSRLSTLEDVEEIDTEGDVAVAGRVKAPTRRLPEEHRSKQPSIFSVLRGLIELFASPTDAHLGFYGALGYDLAFQFEPIEHCMARPADQRDLVLFLPDELVVVDHHRGTSLRKRYEFHTPHGRTHGLVRTGRISAYKGGTQPARRRDHQPGELGASVSAAKEAFRKGDLFEVVLSQTFFEPCSTPPSVLFRRLRERNPAPYGALMNLGDHEYLVGASPEMYVRAQGRRVETCPISGTVARGTDVIADADRIVELLVSTKQASELTMCTDVDRNDKSRICEPGSVHIIGRRQIEMYSRVIHTVDHVEGTLRPEFDALDAFLSHAWAVTITGAPKLWAMRFIERTERLPRAWYGGAIGYFGFDGNINTGLTLRTIRIKDGVAEVRAGSTLLIDSDPEEEERETEMKASAFLDAVRGVDDPPPGTASMGERRPGQGRRVLLVDHEDSFVHTLGSYVRQTGAEVLTVRTGFTDTGFDQLVRSYRPDLVVLSPGPGSPADFGLCATIDLVLQAGLPIFGVCLGLQGLVEYFGGQLELLSYPMHGKPSEIAVRGGQLFAGLPSRFLAGRYHSLAVRSEALPEVLMMTAESDDGVVMAIEHETLPVAAVQFHPESLMTLRDDIGLRLIENVMTFLPVRSGVSEA